MRKAEGVMSARGSTDHASIVSRGGRAPLTLEEGIGGHKQRPYALLNNRRKS
jgi:hypothetical protein